VRPTARAGLCLASILLTTLTPSVARATGGGAAVAAPQTAPVASQATIQSRPLTLTARQLRSMQRRLRLQPDGVLGAKTRAALRRFQRAHRLVAHGRPSVETLRALGLRVADVYEARLTAAAAGAAPAGPLPASLATVAAAVDAARLRIGDPYVSGGAQPGGFDCSGLMVWAFDQAGIPLPRTSFAQFGVGIAVPQNAIQAGDLVFFHSAGPGASHVGVAVSATRAISATSHGVMEHPIATGYWGARYVGARRITA
jgi:cell wall-associated NlpC family hydrolase